MKRKILTITMVAGVVLALASSANAHGGAAKPSTPRALFDVACHAPSTCMAVGPDSTEGQAGVYSVAVAVDGGKRWAVRFQTPRMDPGPVISCGGATSCTMAGNLAPGDRPVTYWTTDGGTSWHLTQVPNATDILTGISCATANICAITGITGAPTAEQTERVAITFDHGATWVVHYLPMGLQVIVECASPSQCYLAGQHVTEGNAFNNSTAVVLRYRVYASGWQLLQRSVLHGLDSLYGFGCNSATRCAGVAARVTETSPGSGTDHFVSIATTDGGTVWRQGRGPELFGGWIVSCPSRTICVAGSAGDSSFPGALMIRSTDGGLTWSEVNLASAQPTASITSAACASEQLCFAVGGQRTQPPGEYAVSILMSTDGGEDWSVVHSL